MTSVILDVYTAISNMALGGVICRNLPEVQLEISEGDLPVRIMLPSTEGEGEFVAIGSMEKVTWQIRDLCLWAPLDMGQIGQVAEPMMQYVKAYLDGLAAQRSPVAATVIAGFAFKIGPIAYGEASYWAVDVTLTVEEWL